MDNLNPFTDSTLDDDLFEEKFSLNTLFGKEFLDTMMQKIAAATGLAVALADFRGEEITNSINYCEFCSAVRKGSGPVCGVWNMANAFGSSQAAVLQKPYIYFCPYDLLMVAIPIIVRGQYLGGFIGGQVRCMDAPPDLVHLKNVIPYDKSILENSTVQKKFEEAPIFKFKKFVDTTELITLIISQLSEKEMVNTLQAKYHNKQMALQQEMQRRIVAEKDLSESKLVALRAQMTPYFLMSTLTAIANIAIVENATQTNEVITMFAQFLSQALQGYHDMDSIGNEMEMIERYLMIQRVRMGKKLSYTIEVPDEVRLQRIPCMILFPFVERAVYYGIACKQGDGKITVTAENDQDDVVVHVMDDGPGLETNEMETLFAQHVKELQGASIDTGMKIARQRMENRFGKASHLKIEAVKGKGTTFTMRYPRLQAKGDV